MSYTINRLQTKRAQAWDQAKMYLDRASSNGDMSASDEAAYERANKEVDRLAGMIRAELAREEQSRSLSDALRSAGYNPATSERRDGAVSVGLREAVRESGGGTIQPGGVTLTMPEVRVAAPLAVGTATSGAETVPTTLAKSLVEQMFDDSTILSANPTILRTASGEPLKLPRLTALNPLQNDIHVNGVPDLHAQVPEATDIQESEPNFDQVSLGAWKYAQIMRVSRELVEDGVLDIEALMGQVLGRNLANNFGAMLVNGAGTTMPMGVVPLALANASHVNSGGGGLFPTTDFDKFLDIVASLHPNHRKNAVWLINDQAMFTLRKIKMNGVYAVEPNLQGAGMPDRFLGYPVIADPNVPVPGPAAGISLVFFNPQAYAVRLVNSVRIEWSQDYRFVNDELAVKAVLRGDGNALDEAAFSGFHSEA